MKTNGMKWHSFHPHRIHVITQLPNQRKIAKLGFLYYRLNCKMLNGNQCDKYCYLNWRETRDTEKTNPPKLCEMTCIPSLVFNPMLCCMWQLWLFWVFSSCFYLIFLFSIFVLIVIAGISTSMYNKKKKKIVVTWKIIRVSEISVIYIYIYLD